MKALRGAATAACTAVRVRVASTARATRPVSQRWTVVAALDRTTGKPVWTGQPASAPTGCDKPSVLPTVADGQPLVSWHRRQAARLRPVNRNGRHMDDR